jgi:hypothetical protein
VRADLERRRALADAIRARESADEAAGRAPVLRLDTEREARLRYLSPSLRGLERATVDEFHRQTSGCFAVDAEIAAQCPWKKATQPANAAN